MLDTKICKAIFNIYLISNFRCYNFKFHAFKQSPGNCFNFHTYFESPVSFSYLGLLNDFLWFPYLSLNLFALMPIYSLISLSSFLVVTALYTMLFVKHFFSSGQFLSCKIRHELTTTVCFVKKESSCGSLKILPGCNRL